MCSDYNAKIWKNTILFLQMQLIRERYIYIIKEKVWLNILPNKTILFAFNTNTYQETNLKIEDIVHYSLVKLDD